MKVGVVGFKIMLTFRASLSTARNTTAQWAFQTQHIPVNVKLSQAPLKLRTPSPGKGVKYLEIKKTTVMNMLTWMFGVQFSILSCTALEFL